MPKYNVSLHRDYYYTITLDARDKAEAEEIAWDMLLDNEIAKFGQEPGEFTDHTLVEEAE